ALVVLPLVASPLASKFRVPRSVQPPHGKLRSSVSFTVARAGTFRFNLITIDPRPPPTTSEIRIHAIAAPTGMPTYPISRDTFGPTFPPAATLNRNSGH